MVGPGNKVLECAAYKVETGIEVRCEYEQGDLLRSQLTADIGTAREIAEAWRLDVVAKGGFTETAGRKHR
jgi:hypothetical protein